MNDDLAARLITAADEFIADPSLNSADSAAVLLREAADEILRLRAEVFVVEQAIAYNDLLPDIDCLATTTRYVVFDDDGEALAYLRTYPYEDARKIGRVASAAAVRGKGFGAALMDAVVADETGLLVLSGQMTVEKFYERYGFTRVGDPYLEEAIDHVWMERR